MECKQPQPIATAVAVEKSLLSKTTTGLVLKSSGKSNTSIVCSDEPAASGSASAASSSSTTAVRDITKLDKMLQQLEAIQRGAMMRNTVAPNLKLKQPLPKPGLSMVRCRMAEPSGKPAPMGTKTSYKDSWVENMILAFTVRRLGKITGVSTTVKGYDGFVELTRKVMQTRSPLLQRASSTRVLQSAIPNWLLKIVKRYLPNNKKTAETFAAATLYAEWLVGPSEVKEVEVNGVMQKSGVLIKKCRYLENSNCVGLCVNMCKIPTQDFFTNSLGVPMTMTPNFEDMSCEMIYGRAPPPLEEDPALQQPCSTLCPTARKKAVNCPKSPPPSKVELHKSI